MRTGTNYDLSTTRHSEKFKKCCENYFWYSCFADKCQHEAAPSWQQSCKDNVTFQGEWLTTTFQWSFEMFAQRCPPQNDLNGGIDPDYEDTTPGLDDGGHGKGSDSKNVSPWIWIIVGSLVGSVVLSSAFIAVFLATRPSDERAKKHSSNNEGHHRRPPSYVDGGSREKFDLNGSSTKVLGLAESKQLFGTQESR